MTIPCPDCDDGLKAADISPGTQPSTEAPDGLLGFQEPAWKPLSVEVLHNELQALKKRVDALEAGEFGR